MRIWVLTKPTSTAVSELCDPGQVTDTPRNQLPLSEKWKSEGGREE